MDTKERILDHIRREGMEEAFTAKDLLAVASRGAIDVALARLAKEGVIRRIGRGLYDCPRYSEFLGGMCAPDLDKAVQAIARKHRWTIAPCGAYAANSLGISQQVPAKVVYRSDGPTRYIRVSGWNVLFRHANPKDLKMPRYSSQFIAQALRFTGKEYISQEVIDQLRRIVPAEDRNAFLEDTQYGTEWIHEVAKRLAEE